MRRPSLEGRVKFEKSLPVLLALMMESSLVSKPIYLGVEKLEIKFSYHVKLFFQFVLLFVIVYFYESIMTVLYIKKKQILLNAIS